MGLLVFDFCRQVLFSKSSPASFFKDHPPNEAELASYLDISTGLLTSLRISSEIRLVHLSISIKVLEDAGLIRVMQDFEIESFAFERLAITAHALKVLHFLTSITLKTTLHMDFSSSWCLNPKLRLIEELVALSAVKERVKRIRNVLNLPHNEIGGSCCGLHDSIISYFWLHPESLSAVFFQPSLDTDSWLLVVSRYRKCLFCKDLGKDQVNSLLTSCLEWFGQNWTSQRNYSTAISILSYIFDYLSKHPLLGYSELDPFGSPLSRVITTALSLHITSSALKYCTRFILKHVHLESNVLHGLLRAWWALGPKDPANLKDFLKLVDVAQFSEKQHAEHWMRLLLSANFDAHDALYLQCALAFIRHNIDMVSELMPQYCEMLLNEHHISALADTLTIWERTSKVCAAAFLKASGIVPRLAVDKDFLLFIPHFKMLVSSLDSMTLDALLARISRLRAVEEWTRVLDLINIVTAFSSSSNWRPLYGRIWPELTSPSEFDAWLSRPDIKTANATILFPSLGPFGLLRRVYYKLTRQSRESLAGLSRCWTPGSNPWAAGFTIAMRASPPPSSSAMAWVPGEEQLGQIMETALFFNAMLEVGIFARAYVNVELAGLIRRFWSMSEITDSNLEEAYYLAIGLHCLIPQRPQHDTRALSIHQTRELLRIDLDFGSGTTALVPASSIEHWPALAHLKTISSDPEAAIRVGPNLIPSRKQQRILVKLLSGEPLCHGSFRDFSVRTYLEAMHIANFLGNASLALRLLDEMLTNITAYNDRSSGMATFEPITIWGAFEMFLQDHAALFAQDVGQSFYTEFLRSIYHHLRATGFHEFYRSVTVAQKSMLVELGRRLNR